mgnify:FL=1
MKTKLTRLWSFLLTLVMVVGLLPTVAIPVFAVEESEEQPKVDSEGYILIWSYEQLVSVAKTAKKGERYRLATDIYQTDSTNDLMIWVRNHAYFSLDLNGHVLSRETRSLDSTLFYVYDGSTLNIYDSSPDKTGTCIYNISAASGTCCVINNNGGNVIINGGNYIIESGNIPDYAAVLLGFSGSFTVYDGYFDSTKAKDGVAVKLLGFSSEEISPSCVVYGGRFYSKKTCIEATCYDNYAKEGVYYPYVFVLGGEFYNRKITGDKYEGNFAYCSNYWGRVIVANGLVPAKSLNATDQRYATGTTKTVKTLTGEPGNGWDYATVTPPPRIVSEQMPLGDRLYSLCWRDYLKAAKEKESYNFWTKYQAEIEAELAKIDGFAVNIFDTEVVLSIEDKEEIDSVRWYVSASPDSDWTELSDYQNITGPITQDPPNPGETLYYRAEVTRKDGTEYEDIIYVNCEEPIKGSAYDEYRLSFNVTPKGEGDTVDLVRTIKESDTFEISWRVPSYMGEGVVCKPEITVTRPNSNIKPKTYAKSKVTIDYSDYPNDVIINCRLYALLNGSVVYFEKTYTVDVKRVYTVTFANGNNAPSTTSELPEAQLVAYGGLAAKPEHDPTAEGWIFGGWMKDPTGYTGYFDFATETITKDITLYADWAEPYYVYFDANGGTGTMKPVAVYPGDRCTLPECGFTAPEGKYFMGWAFNANSTEVVQFKSFEVTGGDRTLYAIWEDITYIAPVDVTIKEPVAGAFPQNAVSHTDNVSVVNTEWWHNGVKMSSSDYFVAGETYKVHVIVYPDSGYGFADSPTVTFNGSKKGTVYDSGVNYINYYAEFTAVGPTIIDAVDVKVTKPVAGAHPQDVVSNTDHAIVTAMEWRCDGKLLSASDTFEEGVTYQLTVAVGVDSYKYEFSDDTIITFNGANTGKYVTNDYDYVIYDVWFTATAASAGVTVSGTATSFGSTTDNVTVQLIASGESTAAYETVVKGNSASYTIEGVAPGTYTMKVMKNNHVTREYTVTVGSSNVVQDVKIHLKGDITGDGKVNTFDIVKMNLHAKKKTELTGYELLCGDITGDGKVNTFDIVKANLHAKKKTLLW